MPAAILKYHRYLFILLTNSINYSLLENTFPDELKHSEVIPLCEKLDLSKKENYWPISLLPQVSKVLEKILYKQIMSYVNNLL